jgi:hypothetical protein
VVIRRAYFELGLDESCDGTIASHALERAQSDGGCQVRGGQSVLEFHTRFGGR